MGYQIYALVSGEWGYIALGHIIIISIPIYNKVIYNIN